MNWFKFDPTKWLTGRINRAPDYVQVAFVRLCCLYWVDECNMTAERAELEAGDDAFLYLVKQKIIKSEGGNIFIDFLDSNMDEIIAKSRTNSVNALNGWETRRKREMQADATAMRTDATAMRPHEVAMPNHAEEKRIEENRKEEKRIEENRKEKMLWFDDFWDRYNKKTEKTDAISQWEKLTDAEINLALDAVDLYIASTPDKKYRKAAHRWLQKKCWNDEIIMPTATAKTKSGQALRTDLLAGIEYDEHGNMITK